MSRIRGLVGLLASVEKLTRASAIALAVWVLTRSDMGVVAGVCYLVLAMWLIVVCLIAGFLGAAIEIPES